MKYNRPVLVNLGTAIELVRSSGSSTSDSGSRGGTRRQR
jgi:hypothetical protein